MKETNNHLFDGGGKVLDRFCFDLNAGLMGDARLPVHGVPIGHLGGPFIFDAGFDFGHTRACADYKASADCQGRVAL
jgi:hypothetical protein